jgi:hypothetical protein
MARRDTENDRLDDESSSDTSSDKTDNRSLSDETSSSDETDASCEVRKNKKNGMFYFRNSI